MIGKNIRSKAVTAAVGMMLCLSLASCGTNNKTNNLIVGIQAVSTEKGTLCNSSYVNSIADFSMEFFRRSMDCKENMMVSPASLLAALSMTENGAKGETLSQMQKVCNWKAEGYAWLKKAEKQSKHTLTTANSIWIREDGELLQVNKEFLETNVKKADAEIFCADFKQDTLDGINRWVKKKTKGMIPKLLDEISEQEIMHLINTVTFDDKWEVPYESDDVTEGEFTNVNGKVQKAKYLYSKEDRFIKDKNAVGVVKPYKNGFSFVAILPQEGLSLDSYMKDMTGSRFLSLIKNTKNITVNTTIPKFKNEYMLDAKNALMEMGVKDAFDSAKADFSGIGTVKGGNLCISNIAQKTYIEVNEQGTRASAATDAKMTYNGLEPDQEIEVVDLNRPFIYTIIDDTTSLPVFMGAVTNMEG